MNLTFGAGVRRLWGSQVVLSSGGGSCVSRNRTEATLVHSAGVIVGLAIHNGHTLNLNLAPAIFRKLLRAPLRLEDLLDVHPDVHRSLCSLLQYPADRIEADMGVTFQVRALFPTRFGSCFPRTALCTPL